MWRLEDNLLEFVLFPMPRDELRGLSYLTSPRICLNRRPQGRHVTAINLQGPQGARGGQAARRGGDGLSEGPRWLRGLTEHQTVGDVKGTPQNGGCDLESQALQTLYHRPYPQPHGCLLTGSPGSDLN